jgi:hypothetical protein
LDAEIQRFSGGGNVTVDIEGEERNAVFLFVLVGVLGHLVFL